MVEFLHKPRLLFILMVLAGILAIILFYNLLPASLSQNQSTDYAQYYQPVAMNILEGHGVTLQGSMAVRYSPGYPILLAAAIWAGTVAGLSNTHSANLLIWICFGLTAGLLYLISRKLWRDWYNILPALLWISYPFALWLAKQPNSEIPFTLLFLLAVYFLILALTSEGNRALFLLLSGGMVGLAMMVRPIAIALGFVLILFWFYCSKRVMLVKKIILTALFLLFCFVPALCWGLSVYRQTGEVVVLSTGGLPSIRDGLTFGAVDKDYRLAHSFPADISGVMEDFNLHRDRMSSNRQVIFVLIGEFIDKPAATLRFFMIKALRGWYALDSMYYEQYTSIIQLIYLCVICLGGVFSWTKGYLEKKYIVLIVLLTLYFWFMTTLVLSIARYITPVFSLLFLLVPGWAKWLKSLTKVPDASHLSTLPGS